MARTVSYKFLTMGYTRFVELTPERFERLPKREQVAIKRTYELNKENISNYTRETFRQMIGDLKGEQRKTKTREIMEKLMHVVEGARAAEVEEGIAKAYVEALKQGGRDDLADRFANLWVGLPEFMRTVLLAEMPNIHAIYEEKGRAYSAHRSKSIRLVREDNIPAIEELLTDYEVAQKFPAKQ